MVDTSTTEFSTDTAAVLAAAEEHEGAQIVGRSPWALAWRRLRRNYVALSFLGLFFVIVIICALAPLYAHHVAHTGPNVTHAGDTFEKNGAQIPVLSRGGLKLDDKGQPIPGTFVPAGIPVGPQWWSAGGRFVFGADTTGRDVAVRLLYGGINSLRIGIGSAIISILCAIVLALLAGYYGGWVDWLITRVFDIIWAFPVFLLAIALGTALQLGGLPLGFTTIQGNSLWIPTLIIGVVLIPYVARPLRGQILSLREKEFIDAAVAQGAGAPRIMAREILPNLASTVLVLFALIVANNILFETGLSFLGAGVRDPDPSWGNLIQQGSSRIATAPAIAIVPGIAIVLTVLALNVFGDGLRDALDPRAKVKI
jgi:peptide/nickel transport system permease protein